MHKVEIRREIDHQQRGAARVEAVEEVQAAAARKDALDEIQQFGDVLSANEALTFLDLSGSAQPAQRP